VICAGQTRRLETEDEADLAHRHRRDEPFKAFASRRSDGSTVSEIRVDDLNLREAQRLGPRGSVILQALAFGMALDLALRGLAQIHHRFALQVPGCDFGMRLKYVHQYEYLRPDRPR
jgi:hypothetical protein